MSSARSQKSIETYIHTYFISLQTSCSLLTICLVPQHFVSQTSRLPLTIPYKRMALIPIFIIISMILKFCTRTKTDRFRHQHYTFVCSCTYILLYNSCPPGDELNTDFYIESFLLQKGLIKAFIPQIHVP